MSHTGLLPTIPYHCMNLITWFGPRLFQIFSMCSDPFVSVELEQMCTLASVVQKSLRLSVVSKQNGDLIFFFFLNR